MTNYKLLSRNLLFWTALLFSCNALSFSIVITDAVTNANVTDGAIQAGRSYKISYSTVSYLKSVNQVSNGAIVSGPISSGQVISKPPGTYYYGPTWCSPQGGGCQLDTNNLFSITVLNPSPPSVSASFNKDSIAEGESATFSWSSQNASSCSGTGVSGISGTYGYVTYTAPSTLSNDITVNAEVSCAGAGGTSEASDSLLVIGGVKETINESFESGMGGWSHTTTKKWIRDANGTPSSGTGPNNASDGSYYVFLETSSGYAYNAGDTAIIQSPLLNTTTDKQLSFNYHMYGSNIGTLYVEVYSQGSWQTQWSRSGQQHSSNSASWSSETISIGTASRVRFRAVAAGGYRGDMAIDKVEIKLSGPVSRKVIFIHTDLLGSPAAETDESGNVR